jgi:hypothetical protein
MPEAVPRETSCGDAVSAGRLALIREVVEGCPGLSRKELAETVCELLGWRRASGRLRGLECLLLLEDLESKGVLALPVKRQTKPVGSRTRIPVTPRGEAGRVVEGEMREFEPIEAEAVETPEQALLFRELVGRHHYLGGVPTYGAQLRYLIYAWHPERLVVGAAQYSSPAWRMAVRDRWIGWDEAARQRNLQRVVNNSRFLILPWVRVKNLASRILSQLAQRVARDWPRRYGNDVVLLETLVDTSRFRGVCYRAANWLALGETTGRGRRDREHLRHGAAPKAVFVYPLVRGAAERLRQG